MFALVSLVGCVCAGCPAPAGDAAPPVSAPRDAIPPATVTAVVPGPLSADAPLAVSPITAEKAQNLPEIGGPTPVVGGPDGPMVGGFEKVAVDLTDVVQAGRQGVALFNARGGDKVAFVRVVSAEKQVVNGVNYRLALEVKGAPKMTLVVHRNLKGEHALRSVDGKDL
ncbi:MAG: hypothetical protein EXR75_09490 [Myxococcales bacterium]|nr:hypothetical protein [Myxococcales bacterium]